MKKIVLLAAVFVLFSVTTSYAVCTTTVPGGTISGVTWTEADSPYCVAGDLIINSLTIEPGVRVQMLDNYQLTVYGLLTAIGTELNRIIFTLDESNAVGWRGIFFDNSLPGNELAYCTIELATSRAINIIDNQPTIRNTIIRDNSGGGISSNSPLTLTNCKILNNSIRGSTSGVWVQGGGIEATADLVLINSEVVGNSATSADPPHPWRARSRGGGIYAAGTLSIIEGEISNNSSYAYETACCGSGDSYSRGGGIYVGGDTAITFSIIQNNSSTAHEYANGSGVYVNGILSLINSIVVQNSTSTVNGGGAIYCGSSSISTITNSTIADNTNQGIVVVNGNVEIANSILWNNTINQISGNATVTYSDVQGGYPGEGNIDLNPVFLAPDDYHIDCTISPMIDAGTNDAPGLPATDIDGESRISCDTVDVGVDECQNCEPCSAQFIISPPSGYYGATQDFDLMLLIKPSDECSVVDMTATLNGYDVTAPLKSCVIPGTLTIGGETSRCPAISSYFNQGTEKLSVTLELNDGITVSNTVYWNFLSNTEP